jgi:hypothetical protein
VAEFYAARLGDPFETRDVVFGLCFCPVALLAFCAKPAQALIRLTGEVNNMPDWIANHWIDCTVAALVIGYVVWWLVKPPSWKDAEGSDSDLVDAGSFKQFH